MTSDVSTNERSWTAAPAPRPRRRALKISTGLVAVLVTAGLVTAGLRGSHTSPAPAGPAAAPAAAAGTGTGTGSSSGLHLKDGVPVGYARTEDGAKSAATNYQIAQSTAGFLANPDVRHKVSAVVMAPDALAQRLATIDSQSQNAMTNLGINANGQTQDGAPLINRQAVLSATVSSFSTDVATVQLWTVAVTGVAATGSQMPPTSEFSTWNYTLTWTGGDWKAVSITRSAALVPQATTGQPSSPNSFRDLGGDAGAPPFAG
ncbi:MULTISPECIES: hypothetical protein [Kitasatospora]|uniref:hypothetical protein n=1 Tax=Kitasatospora TaxID=2063 RepID=UPI0036A60AA5